MSDSIEARVARGAAWLDEHEPGWERRIDLASLDLQNGCRCILGQVWGDYSEWGRKVCDDERRATDYWPGVHGFNSNSDSEDQAGAAFFAALDEAWIALLKERFASGTLSDEATS